MKFKISKDVFLEGLQKVQHVVSSRTTLPILSNVLLVAKDGRLVFTTTDLDVGITGSVEASIDKEGATTLPAKRLVSIVKELAASEVEVTVGAKNYATIKSGPSTFTIIGLADSEFPPLPDFDGAKSFKIPQADLKNGLKNTAFAISTDETDVIIPSKAVSEIQRLLGDAGEVEVKLSDSQISFTVGDTFLASKLIEGNYPNYRQVIPGDSNERVVISREHLLETVRRVSLLSSDKSNSVKLIFTENQIEVTANSPDVGEAQETLEVSYTGPDMQIAFNPEFLQAPLRALDTDNVYLDLIDEMSPGVLRIDGSFLYVLMPMRVTN